jgi:hypothetical protein
MINQTQMIGFVNENGETEALAALNRLNIATLNEVMTIFTQFIKYVELNFISHFNFFAMLLKSMIKLASVPANKHAEILMQAVSQGFSQTTYLNVIFVCCLLTPAEKR